MKNIFQAINLQLFALNEGGVNATVASGTMGTGPVNADLSVEMKTFYDMTLIDYAQAQLVHEQFGVKKPIPKGSGKTIEFRRYHSLEKATTPLTEGVTPPGKALKAEAITSTVEQYGDFVPLDDVLDLVAIDDNVVEATKQCGRQAGLTLDTVVRDILHVNANESFCPKIAADGTETEVTDLAELDNTCQLTVDMVMRVVAKLRAQNAPTIDGKYVAIIHPYVAYDLMRDPEWIDAHKYTTSTNLYEGEIGEIAGVRFVQTTEAKIYENGIFGSLFLGEGAYGVTEINGGGLQTIIKQLGSAGSADPLNQRSTVGWKAMKTAEILIPDYMVLVYSKSKRFSAKAKEN